MYNIKINFTIYITIIITMTSAKPSYDGSPEVHIHNLNLTDSALVLYDLTTYH